MIGNTPVQGQGFGYPPNTMPGRVATVGGSSGRYATAHPTVVVQKPAGDNITMNSYFLQGRISRINAAVALSEDAGDFLL